MRALPIIQRQHATVRVVIVGDKGGYGGAAIRPAFARGNVAGIAGQFDLERIHFLGRIPYPYLIYASS